LTGFNFVIRNIKYWNGMSLWGRIPKLKRRKEFWMKTARKASIFERRRGASLLGYGLIVGLLAVVAIGAIGGVGDSVEGLFSRVDEDMSNALPAIDLESDDNDDEEPEAPSGLYAFTGFTFTPCGQTGATGPDLTACQTAYSSDFDENPSYFNVTAGIQNWTAPIAGSYQIDVYGAQGGTGFPGPGGLGAMVSGTITLTEGEVLNILVGQMGGDELNDIGGGGGRGAGGGGGGSFVTRASANSTPLLAAGGGGGGSASPRPGVTTENGTAGSGGNGPAGTGGNGGGANNTSGAGGGFLSNGAGNASRGGLGFLNGGTGGDNCSGGQGGRGGFGGGGGGEGCVVVSSGGGGGYSGGGGAGGTAGGGAGGGGGSFIAVEAGGPATGANSASGVRSGHGQVVITLLP
jgi:Flp pilus assembly pilin Flp